MKVAQAEKSLKLQSSGNGKQDLLIFLWDFRCGLLRSPLTAQDEGQCPRCLQKGGIFPGFTGEKNPDLQLQRAVGLGRKSPAVIVRDIIDHRHARVYHCSCLFWLAGCRKIKPTQSAQDTDGSVLLINICCFWRGQTWLFLQHFMSVICYLDDGKAYNSDQTIFVLSVYVQVWWDSGPKGAFSH